MDKILNILVDENIPFAEKIFSKIGNVQTSHGRKIKNNDLKDIDTLIVRSITRVDQGLLEDSAVKFVGTATIGTDHIDIEYLNKKSIGFSNASGSNANSVAEYVFAVIFHYCKTYQKKINQLSLGVVGIGNIGSIVAGRAEKLGMKVMQNDPPLELEKQGVKKKLHKLADLMGADIITIHTPLTRTGAHPTYHLFDENILNNPGEDTLLINSARGAVVDNNYLLQLLEQNKIKGAVLDVWEGEPYINPGLLEKVYMGTPHIAGYSFDGKVNGAVMMHNKMCEHFNIDSKLDLKDIIPGVNDNIIHITASALYEETIHNIIKKAYDVEKDFENMKEILRIQDKEQRAGFFDKLRKEYPIRREFYNYKVKLDENYSEYTRLKKDLADMGFQSG